MVHAGLSTLHWFPVQVTLRRNLNYQDECNLELKSDN